MKLRGWLVDDCPTRVALAASAVLGAAVAFSVFGAGYLLGTSRFWTWPVGDHGMMLAGWEYYVHEPWHFPLGHTHGTNGAQGINILFLDTIPLVAFVGKVVHSVVGGHWNPYGPWHLAVYVLQATLATVLARRLGVRSLLGGLGLAMLAISMHAFLWRFYHEGLNAHFVLLWAMVVYLRSDPSRSSLRTGGEWFACLGCAVLLHPYLGAMTALIAVAAMARLTMASPRHGLVSTGTTLACMAALLFLFGYVPNRLPASAGDFGRASMNLMSPFIPYFSRVFPQLGLDQEATGVQSDGGNFLGVGTLVVSSVALVCAPRIVGGLLHRNKALVAVLVLLALYAPSNRWWFGMKLAFHYEIPAALQPLLDNARATGRFFWPVGYALTVAACVVVHRRFGRRGTVLVFLAGFLQLVDSTVSWPIVGNALAGPAKHEIDRERWDAELAGISRVEMYPSYQCWWPTPDVPPRIFEMQREIELVAASRGLRTNGGRAARPITDCAHEIVQRARAVEGVPPPGELHVFFRPAYFSEVLTRAEGRRCVEIGDAFVCRAALAAGPSGF